MISGEGATAGLQPRAMQLMCQAGSLEFKVILNCEGSQGGIVNELVLSGGK